MPTFGQKPFEEHFDELKVNLDDITSEEDKRAAKVKNISLRLLSVQSPHEVLALFEDEFIAGERSADVVATIEELFIFLYFFKS